jgi:hypothetical protein
MNRIALSLLVLVGLGGCAAFPATQAVTYEIDYERTALIERAAAQNGVRVYWINAPQKAVPVRGG